VRQAIVLGVLLGVAMVASYVTWTHADEKTEETDKIAMFRASEGDVTKISWTAEDTVLVAEKKKDDKGDYTWVTVTETITKAKPPEPADTDASTPAPEPEKETKITAFLGNDQAQEMWTDFSPLKALRELETTATTDPKVFGLDTPKSTLELTKGAEVMTMPVGGETWGSKDRYVGLNGKVFLVDDQDLRPLQYGKTRLVERNLQPLAEADLDTVTVTKGTNSVVFTQKNREDRAKAFWSRESAPETADAAAATWLDKLLKVKLQVFVADADAPAQLDPVFDYVAVGKGQAWTVHILRDGAPGPNPEFYARSDFDRGLVKLTRTLAADAAADVDAAMSGTGPITPAAPEPTPPGPHHPMAPSPAEQ
jgi:hypothetical protein